ncbi:MAG: hypothetical protein JRZ94_06290 [Nitrososphaerota archaeon]|nr:hypothetical protein [Nitrososphaerota archaeon]
MQGSFNVHLIGLACVVFVAAAAFLIFDLDSKFYPTPTSYASTIDYSETTKTIIQEPIEIVPVQTPPVTPKKAELPVRTQNEPKSRLNELENKEFSLNLSGDAYASGMVKKTTLILKLQPIKDTNLQEFKILDSRLVLDSSGVSISGTTLQISQKDIAIEFVSDKSDKFIIRATLDEPILSDTNNKQGVSVKDQNFYLINKEVPYRLNLVGTLSG